MAKYKIEVELDWLGEDGSTDEILRKEIIANLQDKISAKLQKQIENKLDGKIEHRASEIVDEYLDKTLRNTVENIKIPYKGSTYSSTVEYVPLTEFIGKRYELFLSEKKLDSDGNLARYNGDAKLSFSDYLLKNYFEKEVSAKVNAMLQKARKDAETMIVKTLEQNLKEQLSVDIIKRLNIPEMLKALQDKAILLEQTTDGK